MRKRLTSVDREDSPMIGTPKKTPATRGRAAGAALDTITETGNDSEISIKNNILFIRLILMILLANKSYDTDSSTPINTDDSTRTLRTRARTKSVLTEENVLKLNSSPARRVTRRNSGLFENVIISQSPTPSKRVTRRSSITSDDASSTISSNLVLKSRRKSNMQRSLIEEEDEETIDLTQSTKINQSYSPVIELTNILPKKKLFNELASNKQQTKKEGELNDSPITTVIIESIEIFDDDSLNPITKSSESFEKSPNETQQQLSETPKLLKTNLDNKSLNSNKSLDLTPKNTTALNSIQATEKTSTNKSLNFDKATESTPNKTASPDGIQLAETTPTNETATLIYITPTNKSSNLNTVFGLRTPTIAFHTPNKTPTSLEERNHKQITPQNKSLISNKSLTQTPGKTTSMEELKITEITPNNKSFISIKSLSLTPQKTASLEEIKITEITPKNKSLNQTSSKIESSNTKNQLSSEKTISQNETLMDEDEINGTHLSIDESLEENLLNSSSIIDTSNQALDDLKMSQTKSNKNTPMKSPNILSSSTPFNHKTHNDSSKEDTDGVQGNDYLMN